MEEYGYLIVPNVLLPEECEKMISGIWDYFEHISKNWEISIDRNNKNTWKQLFNLLPLHGMLYQHFNIGHSQVCWDIRQNENVYHEFKKIWENEDLLVSFDGIGFSVPPEITNRGWHKKTWFHTDQSYTKPDFSCVQGWITAYDVGENDATLSLYKGSHKFHEEFKNKFNITNKSDWYKLNPEEEKFYIEKGCEKINIQCKAGSLVLWDSRTIHCGREPIKGRSEENFRAVIYVCYKPRNLCTKAQLKKKAKAFHEKRMTTHDPCRIKLFPKTPRTYGNKLPDINEIDYPALTYLGRDISGI